MKRKGNIILFISSLIVLFISNPVLASDFTVKLSTSYLFLGLILLLGFLGFVVEMFSSIFGLGILMSIFSFSAFFILNSYNAVGPSYVGYFILGLILLIIEVIIPGFTLTGIAGIVLVSLSIILTVPNPTYGIIMLVVVMTIILSIFVHLFRKGYSNSFIDKLILRETNIDRKKDTKNIENNNYIEYEGKEGTVATDMRPSGTVEIEGVRVDAISEGLYIKKGEKVKVVNVEGNKITVRRS